MSQWTHVSGNIRVDWLALAGETVEEIVSDIELAFGKTVTFETMGTKPCTVPCGSEGSVQYKVVPCQEGCSINFCNVVIWGDLRSYSDVEAIYDWVVNACNGVQMVRACAVLIEVEYQSSYIIYGSYGNYDMLELPEVEKDK